MDDKIRININDIKIMAFDAILERDYWKAEAQRLQQENIKLKEGDNEMAMDND
jgi:extradiol dioxygenase family protein